MSAMQRCDKCGSRSSKLTQAAYFPGSAPPPKLCPKCVAKRYRKVPKRNIRLWVTLDDGSESFRNFLTRKEALDAVPERSVDWAITEVMHPKKAGVIGRVLYVRHGAGVPTADLKRARRSTPRRRTAKRKVGRRARRARTNLRKRISRRRRTLSLPKAGMSKFKAQAAYDRASSTQRAVSREFQKTRELYRAGKITDAFFLAEQAKEKAALAAFDAADADLKAVLAHEEAYSKKTMSLPKAGSGYGKTKYNLRVGDRVKVDLRRNGKLRDGEVIGDAPRISALTAGSVEWLIRVADGGTQGQWVSESSIESLGR